MTSICQEIIEHFGDPQGISQAINSNNSLIYYYLTKIIVHHSVIYSNTEKKEGTEKTNSILAEALITFRRNIKQGKIILSCDRKTVFVGNSSMKNPVELTEYLSNLFELMVETGPMNPWHEQSRSLELNVIKGREFQRFYEFKASVSRTLHGFGCADDEEKEEIFNESLIVFWKKMVDGEIGLFFSGKGKGLDHCRVYNRKFYQASKLNTFLTGIARNLFYNRTRNPAHTMIKNSARDVPDFIDPGTVSSDRDNPVIPLFMFYRGLIETRKVRSLISMLQYECGLDDKEVKALLGLNNTRIHSCRLRTHFHQWYSENTNRMPALLDAAHDYLANRESMREKLNTKIRMVDLFQRNLVKVVDLKIFPEEFRTMTEFSKFHLVFKYVYYFTAAGKPSSLSGLPDETAMRQLLDIFKKELFSLPEYRAILILLFYGSNEPEEIIIGLLKTVSAELSDPEQNPGQAFRLAQNLQDSIPADHTGFTNEVYEANGSLFSSFIAEPTFINTLYKMEKA